MSIILDKPDAQLSEIILQLNISNEIHLNCIYNPGVHLSIEKDGKCVFFIDNPYQKVL